MKLKMRKNAILFIIRYILYDIQFQGERGRTATGSFDLRKVSPPSKHTNTCKGYQARAWAVALQLMQFSACWHRNDTVPC